MLVKIDGDRTQKGSGPAQMGGADTTTGQICHPFDGAEHNVINAIESYKFHGGRLRGVFGRRVRSASSSNNARLQRRRPVWRQNLQAQLESEVDEKARGVPVDTNFQVRPNHREANRSRYRTIRGAQDKRGRARNNNAPKFVLSVWSRRHCFPDNGLTNALDQHHKAPNAKTR